MLLRISLSDAIADAFNDSYEVISKKDGEIRIDTVWRLNKEFLRQKRYHLNALSPVVKAEILLHHDRWFYPAPASVGDTHTSRNIRLALRGHPGGDRFFVRDLQTAEETAVLVAFMPASSRQLLCARRGNRDKGRVVRPALCACRAARSGPCPGRGSGRPCARS